MSQEYTQEPWVLDIGKDYTTVVGRGGRIVVYTGLALDDQGPSEADAARMVSCVNACEGIDDPAKVLDLVKRLVAYRLRVSPAQFQLEKADDFLIELAKLLFPESRAG